MGLCVCLCLYPSSAFAQLLFNCSRLTCNSSARQTDRQSAKRSRLLLLSSPWVSLSLSLCNAIFVASLHSSSSHCAWGEWKEIANCHSNWLFQSPNFQLLSCNLIQSEDVSLSRSTYAYERNERKKMLQRFMCVLNKIKIKKNKEKCLISFWYMWNDWEQGGSLIRFPYHRTPQYICINMQGAGESRGRSMDKICGRCKGEKQRWVWGWGNI